MTNAKLIAYSSKGKVNKVKELLELGHDPNQRDSDGWAPLLAASCEGQFQVVQFLLAFGAKVNIIDREGFTALHYAARFGHINVVQFLLQEGCPVDTRNLLKETALDKAKQGRHKKIVEILDEAMKKKLFMRERRSEAERIKKATGKSSLDMDDISDFVDEELNLLMIDDIARMTHKNVRSDDQATREAGRMRGSPKSPQYAVLAQSPPTPRAPSLTQSHSSADTNRRFDAAIQALSTDYPRAYHFWVESFDQESVVPIERFLFALDMYNSDRVEVPNIRLKEMNIPNFKTLLSFNSAMKSLFGNDSAVASSPVAEKFPYRGAPAQEQESAAPTALDRIKSRNPAAHEFWQNNFLDSMSVSSDLFNLAIQLHNVNELPIKKVEAPMVDAKMFNILCNGPLKELFKN